MINALLILIFTIKRQKKEMVFVHIKYKRKLIKYYDQTQYTIL